MRDELSIVVNSQPLDWVGKCGDVEVVDRWPGGSWSMSWSMSLRQGQRPSMLKRGAEVLALCGSSRRWRGFISEIDFDEGRFVALGSVRQAETALALDGAGAATAVPNTAIDEAEDRAAISWGRTGLYTISGSAFVTPDPADLQSVAALVEAWALSEGKNFWVDPTGYARADVSPTTPKWTITPDVVELGLVDEDYVTHLYGRYSPSSGTYATVISQDQTQGVGRVERGVDLTGLGILTTPKAQAVLDGMLEKLTARTGWTTPIQVGYGQVFTMGGTRAALSQVYAGPKTMVHLSGLRDARSVSASTNVVVAESTWRVTDRTLTLNPVGLAARDLSSIVESLGGALL